MDIYYHGAAYLSMKPSEFRESLRGWLNDMVWVQEWTLRPPDNLARRYNNVNYPPCTAFDTAITQCELLPRGLGNCDLFSCIVTVAITYRFRGNLKEEQLPSWSFEAMWSGIAMRWLKQFKSVSEDIQRTYLGNISEPILINKGNDTTDDWLVTLVLPFGVQYIYDFEESGLQPPNWDWLPPDRDLSYDVRLVHWREGIDKETAEVKDYDYLIDNPLN